MSEKQIYHSIRVTDDVYRTLTKLMQAKESYDDVVRVLLEMPIPERRKGRPSAPKFED